ncbi:MAG: response regulator transcription factor [bacterium]|nr:response regulator transcription factor [bacterium]
MKIIIVEDEPFFIEKLKLILGGEGEYEIVCSYPSAEEALSGYKEGAAEVMLIDIVMPGMSGIELMKIIKGRDPIVEIVAFTGSEDRETVLEAIRAGASGYLLKDMSPGDIFDSLNTISKGGSPMSPKIVRALVNEIQSAHSTDSPILSKREREVLGLAAEKLSYKEIGQKLNISHHTVHTHLKNICEKLKVKARKEAISIARRKSLI